MSGSTQMRDVWALSIQRMCSVSLMPATQRDTAGQRKPANLGVDGCLDIMSVIDTQHTGPTSAGFEPAIFGLEVRRFVNEAEGTWPSWRSANVVRPGGAMYT